MTPHELFERNARTFSAAARWLPAATRDRIATLYAFCRTVDDLADEAADGAALDALSRELAGEIPASPLVDKVRALGVPLAAARQLVDGVRSDLGQVRVPDEDALVRYGYHVAGTVGLLTCPVLGAHDPRAWPFAVDLGIGMQLTNIARDVGEDAGRDRVYLPATWLAEAGASAEDVLAGRRDEAALQVVARMLDLAERYYASADAGMRFLPWRARLAVALAARRYRAIGRAVRARGAEALRSRTVLGPWARLGFWLGAPLVALRLGWRGAEAHVAELHRPVRALLAAAVAEGA